MKIAPSTAKAPFRAKATESIRLLCAHMARRMQPASFEWVFADLEEYDRRLSAATGGSLQNARVLEIGYGARPFRLLALLSLGVDAVGVDAEVPLLEGSLRELQTIYTTNGAERLMKSLVRYALFDSRERSAFQLELLRRGHRMRVEKSRFLVMDAANLKVEPWSLDLVFSEDVFEHISRKSLEKLVPKMARWLKPDGLALVRPNIYTGITGGHLVEWNDCVSRHRPTRKSEPWEHLRKQRYQPNTSLNRLTRSEYRALFSRNFEIVEEVVKNPDLGRDYLTPEAAAELRGYADEELFSNQVMFELRPRADGPSHAGEGP